LRNFYVELFRVLKCYFKFTALEILKIKITQTTFDQHSLYQSCSSQYKLQLCSLKVLDLKSLTIPNMWSNFIDFENSKLDPKQPWMLT
jgi:hypothetical protein